jgi:hypothetical protein
MKCANIFSHDVVKESRIDTNRERNLFMCPECFFIHPSFDVYNPEDIKDSCGICLDEETYNQPKVLYQCGHFFCISCSKLMSRCPFCSVYIKERRVVLLNDETPFVEAHLRRYKRLYIFLNEKSETYTENGRFGDAHIILLALIKEYDRWLTLLSKYGGARQLSPSVIIDEVWHIHLLDIENYIEVCLSIFGKVLGHYPENAFETQNKERQLRRERTYEAYIEEFGKSTNDIDCFIWDKPSNKQNKEDELITVFVKHLKTHTLRCRLSQTVMDLKLMYADLSGVSPSVQRLIYLGKALVDDSTLLEIGVAKECTIHHVCGLRGC